MRKRGRGRIGEEVEGGRERIMEGEGGNSIKTSVQ